MARRLVTVPRSISPVPTLCITAAIKRGVLMRSILFVSTILALSACGDDGGSSVDAMPMIDAAPDGPGATTGLGQLCGQGMPA